MMAHKSMTWPQERAAYRRTVAAVLVSLFEKDNKSADKMVHAWWERLSKTSAYRSGIFMHAEPLHTAADLMDIEKVRLTEDQRVRYVQLLQNIMKPMASNRLPLRSRRTSPSDANRALAVNLVDRSTNQGVAINTTTVKKLKMKSKRKVEQLQLARSS
jgi:hypothetical protein